MNIAEKIKSFRDLLVWRKAHNLTLLVYEISVCFPKSEIFSLTSQMRRSAVSVVSNIVEGFARKGAKEKIQFYFHAKSSLVELQSQLEIAKDLKYFDESKFNNLEELAEEIHKMISGLIKNQRK